MANHEPKPLDNAPLSFPLNGVVFPEGAELVPLPLFDDGPEVCTVLESVVPKALVGVDPGLSY